MIFAAAALGASALQTAFSMKANRAERRASRAQQQQQAIRFNMERRQQIRAQRMAAAIAEQTGENQGVADSSGSLGGIASINTQGAINMGALQNQYRASQIAGSFLDKASSYQTTAGVFGGVANLFNAAAGMPGAEAQVKIPPGFGTTDMTDAQRMTMYKPPGGAYSTNTFGNSNIYR